MKKGRKKLRIVFISQYFPPEVAAPAVRVHETCREWVRMGHDVTVLCGFPHHPTGIVPERYKRLIVKREKLDGIKVIRTWLYAAPNRGFLKRSFSYLSFMISAIITGSILVRRPDVIIATSPQLLVGVSGYVLSKLRRCPFVFEVRDLWPDALTAVGVRIPRLLYGILKSLEHFLYKKAKLIVVVTDSFRKILKHVVGRNKIFVLPNGVDVEMFSPGRGGGKGVAYIGTLGLAHRLDFLIRTAKNLPQITFNLIGDGADRSRLEKHAMTSEARNVRFWGIIPRMKIPSIIRSMDICIVALRKSELFQNFIPSKMFEFMGCARPLILACEGESAEIAKKSGGVLLINPESEEELVGAIKKLMMNSHLRKKMGIKGRRFVEAHYDRKNLSKKYIRFLAAALRL